jgi:hypothetical protein
MAHMAAQLRQVKVSALFAGALRTYRAAPVVSVLAYLPYEWCARPYTPPPPTTTHHIAPQLSHTPQVSAGGDGPIAAGAALPRPHLG